MLSPFYSYHIRNANIISLLYDSLFTFMNYLPYSLLPGRDRRQSTITHHFNKSHWLLTELVTVFFAGIPPPGKMNGYDR